MQMNQDPDASNAKPPDADTPIPRPADTVSSSPHRSTAIERIIDASARNPFLVVVFVILGIAAGIYALYQTPLDAIPDLFDVQVIVYTDWEGRSPDLVVDHITYPYSSNSITASQVESDCSNYIVDKQYAYN